MSGEVFDGPVALDMKGSTAYLTIDRAEQRNALNTGVLSGLSAAMKAAAASESCAVIVVTGAGNRAFSAGGDLSGNGMQDGAAAAHFARSRLGDLVMEMHQSRLPIIARVNGHALGGGFGLMLACDVAVASDDVELGMPEIDLGLWPFLVSSLVRRHVGPKIALELMLTGRRMAAGEAAALGFLNRVVASEELDDTVDAIARVIGSKSPATLALGKRAFYTSQDMATHEALEYLAGMLTLCLQSEDAAEGISAFLQKRPPEWKGR